MSTLMYVIIGIAAILFIVSLSILIYFFFIKKNSSYKNNIPGSKPGPNPPGPNPPGPNPPGPNPSIVNNNINLQNIQNFLDTNYKGDDNYGKIFTGYIPKVDGYLPSPNFFGNIDDYNSKILNPTKIYPFSSKKLPDTGAMKGPLSVYNMIITAKKSVDWIGLWFFQDDIWLTAITQGILDLDKTTNSPILVRFFWGRYFRNPTEMTDDLEQYLINLTKSLKQNSLITVMVGQARVGEVDQLSWNHGKILNIDGQKIFTGGENWWTTNYLSTNPIFDLNIIVEGQNDMATHYTNKKWKALYTEIISNSIISDFNYLLNRGYVFNRKYKNTNNIMDLNDVKKDEFLNLLINEQSELYVPKNINDYYITNVLPVSKYPVDQTDTTKLIMDVSEAARLYAFKNAKTRIYMSQQSVQSTGTAVVGILPNIVDQYIKIDEKYMDRYFDIFVDAIGTAINNDVEVCIITSTYSPLIYVDSNYAHGYRASKELSFFAQQLKDFFTTKNWNTSKVDKNLKQKYVSYDNKQSYFQHDKFWLVDNFFYMGSHNIYYCKLSEFGVICENPALVNDVLTNYWFPKWNRGITDINEMKEADKDAPKNFIIDGK